MERVNSERSSNQRRPDRAGARRPRRRQAGITTGISAADRAHTIRLLADSTTDPHDLVRPGHVLPLRARAGGVLRRPGHTEAAVDLARLAGLTPVGALCEIASRRRSRVAMPATAPTARPPAPAPAHRERVPAQHAGVQGRLQHDNMDVDGFGYRVPRSVSHRIVMSPRAAPVPVRCG